MFNFLMPKVPKITVEELKKEIEAKSKYVLLDVRTAGEYERGHLPESIHLPVDEVDQKIENIIADKNAKIYVYCLSGSRSVMAVDVMIKKGYKNVYDVDHGLLAWRAKGFAV